MVPLAAIPQHYAATAPAAACFRQDGETLDWAGLEARASRWARLLVAHGVGPDALVAMSMANGAEFLAASFGIWKAGATPAPLSPKLTAAERREILEIAFKVGADIAVEPDRPLPVGAEMEGRSRKASPSCQSLPVFRFGVVVTEHLTPRRILRRQQLRPQPPPASPRLLATRHRPEREIARPPGERLRHAAHQKEVRRTGEEEPPRHALLVDRPLDRPEEKGLALHLVDG